MTLASLAIFAGALLVAAGSSIAALIARVRQFLKSPRAGRIVNRTSAGLMAGAAAAIAVK